MAASAQQLRQRAHVQALLKYDPQRQAIQQLALEARQNALSSVQGAASTGRLTTAAINKAIPTVQGVYDRATGTSTATNSQLGAALAALGPQAAGFNAAATSESAAGADKLARERAATEGNLQEQKVAAAEAPQFARTLAQQQLGSTLAKLQKSYESLAGEEGAAQSDAFGKALDQAEGRATTERGQDKTAASAAAGRSQSAQQFHESQAQKKWEHEHPSKSSSGGRLGPNGEELLPLKEQVKAQSIYGDIYAKAAHLHGAGVAPAQIEAALQKPRPSRTVTNSDGSKSTTPGHEGYAANGLLKAAVEEAVYGKVSKQTLGQVAEEGYDTHRFRLKTKSLRPPARRNSPEREYGIPGA